MAAIKSYTDLEQSKKLAEILPLESADMCWTNHYYGTLRSSITISAKSIDEYRNLLKNFADLTEIDVFYPAWSLAALLGVLPDYTLQTNTDGTVFVVCESKKPMISDAYDNPVDACVAMIERLHELNLL